MMGLTSVGSLSYCIEPHLCLLGTTAPEDKLLADVFYQYFEILYDVSAHLDFYFTRQQVEVEYPCIRTSGGGILFINEPLTFQDHISKGPSSKERRRVFLQDTLKTIPFITDLLDATPSDRLSGKRPNNTPRATIGEIPSPSNNRIPDSFLQTYLDIFLRHNFLKKIIISKQTNISLFILNLHI